MCDGSADIEDLSPRTTGGKLSLDSSLLADEICVVCKSKLDNVDPDPCSALEALKISESVSAGDSSMNEHPESNAVAKLSADLENMKVSKNLCYDCSTLFRHKILKGKNNAFDVYQTLLRFMRSYGAAVVCPYHPDANLLKDYRAGGMICSECGLVVGDRVIDVGSEWRTFSNEKADSDPSRVGAAENLLLNGRDLSTVIGRGTRDASFDDTGVAKYQNRRTMSSSGRALINAFKEIGNMADRINLPKTIVDRANCLFKQVHDVRTLKGRSNDAIASSCVYIACRQEGVPLTFKEICAVSKVSKKEIGRCFKLILKALETSVDLLTTGDFMFRFCSILGLPTSVQKGATYIARKAAELDIVASRSPISVAAAAIYMASQASEDKISQEEIRDVSGVADVTIQQSYKLMYPRANALFPPDFKFFTPIENLPQL